MSASAPVPAPTSSHTNRMITQYIRSKKQAKNDTLDFWNTITFGGTYGTCIQPAGYRAGGLPAPLPARLRDASLIRIPSDM